MNYQLITNNHDLSLCCQEFAGSQALSLDTEFIRTRTYYPKIGLLQVYDGKQVVLIDPVNISDWQCCIDVLKHHTSPVYFHACSEDIDVFQHHFNFVPTPLFDSQIFAAFLDNPLSSGYANLVNKYLSVVLDKSETRTDWLLRPLSEKQCHYAAADVYYLKPLMDVLISELQQKGWLNAAIEECESVVKRKQVEIDPNMAYLNLKQVSQLKGIGLAYLQQLAKWRLITAKENDIAVNFIVQEEVLLKIARFQPSSLSELEHLGMRGKEIRLYGETILNIVRNKEIEPLPAIKRIVDYADYKNIAKKLKDTADIISQQTGLSAEILLCRRQINQYVEWLYNKENSVQKPELISGWRSELFKNYL